MVGARDREHQGFGKGTELPDAAREQRLADLLGGRRAAGLARGEHLAAGARQPVGENAGLGRLAGALAAFECDESAGLGGFALHCISGYNSQPKARTSNESNPRMAKLLWSMSSPA